MFVISPPLEAPKAKYHFVLQRVVQPETDAIGWARYWHIATQTSRTLFWMHHSVYILQKSTFKWPTVIVSDHLADTGECVLHTHTTTTTKTYTERYSQWTFLLQSSVTMRYIIASSVCYKTRWMSSISNQTLSSTLAHANAEYRLFASLCDWNYRAQVVDSGLAT